VPVPGMDLYLGRAARRNPALQETRYAALVARCAAPSARGLLR